GKPGEPGNPWGVEFRQGLFNMTSDSHLFRTAEQLSAKGWERQRTDWIKPAGARSRAPALALEGGRDAAHLDLSTGGDAPATGERYVPLYEAKMIHQFDHRWAIFDGIESRDATPAEKGDPAFGAAPRYWVQEGQVRSRLAEKNWHREWLLGWRDITNATNERTVITSFFPVGAVGHTMPLFFFERRPQEWAAF